MSAAQRDANITRGNGVKEGLDLLAAATGRDPEFYAFYRSLQAYKNGMNKDNTTLVISPDSPFFKYFNRGMK